MLEMLTYLWKRVNLAKTGSLSYICEYLFFILHAKTCTGWYDIYLTFYILNQLEYIYIYILFYEDPQTI